MGLLDSIFGHKTTPEQILQAVSDLKGVGNGSINTATPAGQAKAYEQCAAVRTVINTLCTYIQQFQLYQANNAEEEVDGAEYIEQLAQPNPYQSLREFVAAVELSVKLFGRAYIWKDTANDGDIYVLPNAQIEEQTRSGRVVWTKPNGNVTGYTLTIYGQRQPLVFDDVYILHDTSLDLHKLVTGESRLVGLSDCVNAFIGSYSAAAETIQNRGPLGIVSIVPPDSHMGLADAKQIKDAEAALKQKYGVLSQQFRYIVTSWNSSFVPITASMDDMHLDTNRTDARNEIAAAYGVPTVLFEQSGATYANLATAERALYQNVLNADARAIFALINKIKGFNLVQVWPYFDHLPCFQQQRREEAQAFTTYANALHTLYVDGVISVEEYREKLDKFEIK